jgi:hypothetical protein
VSFTWKDRAVARRFVGVLGGATDGLGAAVDELDPDDKESPVAATTAPIAPTTRMTAPTTITTIGHRRRDGGVALGGDATAVVGDVADIAGSGVDGMPSLPAGGGGNSSMESLSPSIGDAVLSRENPLRDDAP